LGQVAERDALARRTGQVAMDRLGAGDQILLRRQDLAM
jgi:hypothetical protein